MKLNPTSWFERPLSVSLYHRRQIVAKYGGFTVYMTNCYGVAVLSLFCVEPEVRYLWKPINFSKVLFSSMSSPSSCFKLFFVAGYLGESSCFLSPPITSIKMFANPLCLLMCRTDLPHRPPSADLTPLTWWMHLINAKISCSLGLWLGR